MAVDGERAESSTLDDAYYDRNQAAMLAARLAWMVGYFVGWKPNEDDPDWPILFIDLPAGQVSWHIPRSEVGAICFDIFHDGLVPLYNRPWDGHTVEEKRRRISAYLKEPPLWP